MDLKDWKIIPEMERYIISKTGEVRNRFTKKIIFTRKKDDLIMLTTDKGERVTRSPRKIVKKVYTPYELGI